jgi:GH25 family lysozyme M1 (1,4-beta-N-acetylmuramidase)
MAYVTGVDVSAYQTVTFPTTGLSFAAVKATEGASYINPRHDQQVTHARAAGLVVLHYHFLRPGHTVQQQAAYFLQHARPAAGDILAADWEDWAVTDDQKNQFLAELLRSAPTHRRVLYTNLTGWKTHDRHSVCGDGLWIADPDRPAGRPEVLHPWTFHQYGIRNGIDVNVANFQTQAALKAWATALLPRPKPPAPTLETRVATLEGQMRQVLAKLGLAR